MATQLVVPGSNPNSTNGASESTDGHVVGTYDDSEGQHEFIYHNGAFIKSGVPKNGSGQPLEFSFTQYGVSVNNSGTAVGEVDFPPHYIRGSAFELFCKGPGC